MSEPKTSESVEARKQRRRAAGRSGGEFEIVRNSERLSYRYVWPDKEKDFVDRVVSWACAGPSEDTAVAESQEVATHIAQAETNEDNLNRGSIESKVPDTLTGVANDDIGSDETMTSGKGDGKERGAFTKLHRRISGWFHRKKDDGKEHERDKGGHPASEQDQPWILKPQLLSLSSESLTKENLEHQDGRVSRHEGVNRGFFTASERSMDSARQSESGIRCSNVVDDHEFSDWD